MAERNSCLHHEIGMRYCRPRKSSEETVVAPQNGRCRTSSPPHGAPRSVARHKTPRKQAAEKCRGQALRVGREKTTGPHRRNWVLPHRAIVEIGHPHDGDNSRNGEPLSRSRPKSLFAPARGLRNTRCSHPRPPTISFATHDPKARDRIPRSPCRFAADRPPMRRDAEAIRPHSLDRSAEPRTCSPRPRRTEGHETAMQFRKITTG